MSGDASGSMTDDEAAAALRRAGLRLTRPRLAVLGALRALGGHRSADEVMDSLRGEKARVSRMTVYNALGDLETARVILRADAGPGRTLFEARSEWHHHFVCRRCDAVLDVPCVRGRKPCMKLAAPVGEADEAQVIFRGICRRCGGGRKAGKDLAGRRRGASPRRGARRDADVPLTRRPAATGGRFPRPATPSPDPDPSSPRE